mgnify:CR=1 FL=1
MQTTVTFSVKSWDEKTYAELEGGRKLTRVLASFAYTGDLQAEGELEYLMAYAADGTGRFVGLERVTGSLNGQAGTFVTQHTGTFDPASVKINWLIVAGTGTDALEKLQGGADMILMGHGPYTMQLNYEL